MMLDYKIWMMGRNVISSGLITIAIGLASIITLATTVKAQDIAASMDRKIEQFSADSLIGRWTENAVRRDGEISQGNDAEIYFAYESNAASNKIELHTKARKWEFLSSNVPRDGAVSAEYSYYPNADEMNPRIPQELRNKLEGVLEWQISMDMRGPDHSPLVRLAFTPGEVKWTYDEITGEITEYDVVGRGKITERFYGSDPILQIARRPVKRLEVLAFTGPTRAKAGETVTPRVFSMIQGQKIYPQAYLDEEIQEDVGNRISLKIRGLTSGATVELPMETRGSQEHGEVRYGISLARVSHPLGRAITLGNCESPHSQFYPPFLSNAWIESYLLSDAVQKTREKGNCIPFSGVSGEIVEFDIGDGAVFRVQWFEHWEEFVLAEHRRTAERMRTAFDNGGNSEKSAIYSAMVERYINLVELPSLTRKHKLALAELYFGGGRQSEYGGMEAYYHIYSNPHAADAPKGGLLFYPSERADHALGTHDFHILNLREFNRKQGVHAIQVERLDLAQEQRDAALSVFPQNWRSMGKFISLERILVDRAILFVEAGAVSKLGDYLVTDGIKLFYQAYSSFNPVAKVQTLFTREDAFGNKVTDEQYWLNVVDVALEFVTLGFATYEATSPFRYYNSGTDGKLVSGQRSLADLSSGGKRSFRARMATAETTAEPVFAIRNGKRAQTQVLQNSTDLDGNLPPTLSPSQRTGVTRSVDASDHTIAPNLRAATDETVTVRLVNRRSTKRGQPTQILVPDNPLAEFGGNARVVDRELTQFKASNPDRPDAAAANYVVWRETGHALAEAQGNQRFLLAMEGMSEGQSRMIPGAFTYNHSQPVPDGVFTRRLQLEGIESSRINGASGLNLSEVRAATGAGWTAEVKIKGNGQHPRRVYIERIQDGPYGLSQQVRFFDPVRGQIIELDGDVFYNLARVDKDSHVTLYRARHPKTDRTAIKRAKLDFENTVNAVEFDGTPRENTYYQFKDGNKVLNVHLGNKLGEGKFNVVFEAPDQPGSVYRISRAAQGNLDEVVNDLFGRRVLSDPALDPNIIEPLKVHKSKVVAQDGNSIQVIELVDRHRGSTGASLLEAQGGNYTKGQQLAYVLGIRELNKRGIVAMDLHRENIAFIPQPGQDRWKIQIFDPGGMYPAKGSTAIERMATATRMQNDAFKPYKAVVQAFGDDINSRGANGWQLEAFFEEHRVNVDFERLRALDPAVPAVGPDMNIVGSFWAPFREKGIRDLMQLDANQLKRWQTNGRSP